jgi:hypothetical protein
MVELIDQEARNGRWTQASGTYPTRQSASPATKPQPETKLAKTFWLLTYFRFLRLLALTLQTLRGNKDVECSLPQDLRVASHHLTPGDLPVRLNIVSKTSES